MDEEKIKVAVSDVMSDFYHQVLKSRFDAIGNRFDNVDEQLIDLRLTTQALVKVVDYARLESKVKELEDRLSKLESRKAS